MKKSCVDHDLPGFSSTYSAAWTTYEETKAFVFLTVCFRECRRLGWEIPEPVLSAMDSHFDDLHKSDCNEQARKALSLATASDGTNDLRRAREYWDAENLRGLFTDLEVLGVKKDQISMIAGFLGRTEAAIKQAKSRLGIKRARKK